MVLAVLVEVTLSANLDSSSSLAKAKRLVVVVNGCGSLAPELEGGRSSLGCGHDVGVARQRSASVQEHVPRQYQTDRQRLVCGVNASHGDSLSAQNCCC